MLLTDKQVSDLAQLDRDMDAGIQPYVIDDVSGMRWSFPQEVLDQCGVVSGQRASYGVMLNLQHRNLANLQTEIAIRNMMRKE